jgi:signal transduction histidine kinase/uncharacterized protein (DUF2141 family)
MNARRLGWLIPSAFGAAALALAPAARALEPSRALTQFVHRIWQTQQGLPESPISDIFQSRDGYLWVATQTGMARFDGVRFTPLERVYEHAPAGEWVREAFEDESGTLWLATNDSGVYAVRNGGTTNYGHAEGLPANLIQCLAPGAGGSVWACTENGVARIDPGKTPAVTTYGIADGLAGPRVWSGCVDAEGSFWAGGDNARLSVWRNGAFHVIRLEGIPETASTRALECDGGTVWAGTTNGLVRIQPDGRQKLYTTAAGLVDNFILSLDKGSHGTLWIGTRNGFSRMRGETIDSYFPRHGLSQSSAQAVFEDREGSLWVGTKRGLNQFLDGRSVPYTVSEGLPSNEAGPVLQDSAGVIWAGTLDAGLARFDGKRFTSSLTTREGLLSDTVHALAEDADRSLWVGTARGLNRVREGRVAGSFTAVNGLPSNDVRSLYRDRRGVIWVGTTAGLARYQGGRFVGEPGAPRRTIRAVVEDREGSIVVATEESLYTLRPEGFRELTQDGVYMRNATSLYRDAEGLLWVGLNGAGLRLVDGDRITSFNTRVGLYDGEIYGVTGDNRGRLWMTCSRGVFWVQRAQLLRLAAGEIRSVASFAYTPTDSLRVIEARLGVQPSLWIARDGWLWFSTIRGLIAFDPNFQREAPLPAVAIEDPIVDGQSQPPDRISKLPAGQKNIEFRYAGLSYLLPEGTRFRYKLEGYDTDWVEAGTRREAFYTNLPPGAYRFQVVACVPGVGCNQEPAAVAFSLAPSLYQRAWFWPLVAVAAALAGWLGYKLHIRRLRERYDLILAERSRIARELHDTLIQGFSGITMALQAFAGRIRAPEDRAMLDDIIQDAATCLRETRQSVAGLRATPGPHSGLASAISRAVREIAETKDVRLKLDLDERTPQLPAEVEYNLLRIASEAVSNAVKHSGASTIEVGLHADAEQLRLSVRDDGVGFDGENGGPRAGHYGLIGMKERATQIGAELQLTTQPGAGTSVSVVLPAARAMEVGK